MPETPWKACPLHLKFVPLDYEFKNRNTGWLLSRLTRDGLQQNCELVYTLSSAMGIFFSILGSGPKAANDIKYQTG